MIDLIGAGSTDEPYSTLLSLANESKSLRPIFDGEIEEIQFLKNTGTNSHLISRRPSLACCSSLLNSPPSAVEDESSHGCASRNHRPSLLPHNRGSHRTALLHSLNCPINPHLVLLLAIPPLILHLCNSLQSISSSSSPSPPHNRPPLLVRRRSSHKHPLQHSRPSTHPSQTPCPQLSSAKRTRRPVPCFRDFSREGVQYRFVGGV